MICVSSLIWQEGGGISNSSRKYRLSRQLTKKSDKALFWFLLTHRKFFCITHETFYCMHNKFRPKLINVRRLKSKVMKDKFDVVLENRRDSSWIVQKINLSASLFFSTYSVEKWKITFTEKIFRQISYLLILSLLVKTSFSRDFCQTSGRVKFCSITKVDFTFVIKLFRQINWSHDFVNDKALVFSNLVTNIKFIVSCFSMNATIMINYERYQEERINNW